MEARAVCEIVPLPEVLPLEETPGYVIGVVNLRGQIVPVIDLHLRFGHPPQPYRLQDCIIILEWAETVVGLLVNEVRNVRDIAPEERVPVPSYGEAAPADTRFLMGLMKSGEQVVMLLDLAHLLNLAHGLPAGSGAEGKVPLGLSNRFCSDATPEERAVFRERTRSLAQPSESLEQTGLLPVAVVRLGEEFFGIELQTVREFAELRSVTPVPCCPPHIVGQMNLRGDLLTLLDIAGTLGLPPGRGQAGRKVVVVNSAEMGAGIVVDAVLDVLTLHPADVVPALGSGRIPGTEYLRGTAPYGTRMLTLLDLPTLLKQENLLVHENP